VWVSFLTSPGFHFLRACVPPAPSPRRAAWCSGGSQRASGFTHIGGGIAGNGGIGVVDGASSCALDGDALSLVRVYDRALLVSEAIGNWRHAAARDATAAYEPERYGIGYD